MYVANTRLTEHTDKRDTGRHLVVLAKNAVGYHNLIKLVSKAWTEGFYSHPRTDKFELEKYHEGLIIARHASAENCRVSYRPEKSRKPNARPNGSKASSEMTII